MPMTGPWGGRRVREIVRRRVRGNRIFFGIGRFNVLLDIRVGNL